MFVVYGILILSVIVFVHEMGHFIAAKFCGVQVDAFSIGMGPVLLHKKIGNTDWRISLLPVGGYCAMRGEKEDPLSPEFIDDKTSFYGTHPLKRAVIAFAGPFSNFLFATFAFTVIFMVGYDYYSANSTIKLANEIDETIHSPAADAGLLTGDKILSINDVEIQDFSELFQEVGSKPDEDIQVKVLRGSEEMLFSVHSDLDKNTGLGKIGVTTDSSSIELKHSKTYSLFPAIGHGLLQSVDSVCLTVKGIVLLFKGVEVKKAVSGPARVTAMLGSTVENGFSHSFQVGLIAMLQLMGIINISLFFMNLLPIPVLDGGLIMIAFIEFILRRRISTKIQNVIQYIGIFLIIALMAFAVTNDISFFLEN